MKLGVLISSLVLVTEEYFGPLIGQHVSVAVVATGPVAVCDEATYW